MTEAPKISVNNLAGAIVDRMVTEADRLRIIVSKGSLGETSDRCRRQGGRRLRCRSADGGNLSGRPRHCDAHPYAATAKWPFHLTVRTADPVIACLASQYAGWACRTRNGSRSAPARRGHSRARSRCSKTSAMPTSANGATLVVEGGKPPPPEVVEKVSKDTAFRRTTDFIYAPTRAWPAACRSSPACWKSRCTRRTN